MEDYENNSFRENASGEAAESEKGFSDNDRERTDDLQGASSDGYTYHADGTYSYIRPSEQKAEHAAPESEPSGYVSQPPEYSGQHTEASQPAAPYATEQNAAYPGQNVSPRFTGGTAQNGGYQNGQNGRPTGAPYGGNGAYPYANNPYPYRNAQRGYAYGENGNGQKKSSGGKIFGIVTGALCLILIAALVVVIVTGKKNGVNVPDTANAGVSDEEATGGENANELVTAESPEAVGKTGAKGELTAKEIYQKVLATSVGVLVYNKSDSLASEGSGVLFQQDNDGKYTYVVTCAHVISDADVTIMVQMHDEQQYKAEIVGYDHRTDIGVLKIEAAGLQLAEIGDSDKLAVGDTIYAIGNPGGVEFANSFTSGMVSALDRPVNSSSSGYTMECIQHTAAINPGNSGGALVNVFGQVIGINSMKIVDDEYEGMGFSVPSSVFVDIVNNIISHGYVANRPKLGITYVAAQNYNSYGMFVAIKELPKGSIVIYSIAADSSLANTDAKEGDLIVAVNGVDLDDSSYLPELVEKSKVGDKLTLSLVRINRDYSYEEFEVTATLVEDRGNTVLVEETTTEQEAPEDYFRDYFDDYFNDYFGDFFH
ncbi:MAG: trypsin-like peptidase domain-containing protein [Clostridia bacterium]|nr:trypsin-like peptidase domain-containing protein [Clostridia bacterium]